MNRGSPTRGFGLLEAWLARARADRADALIPEALRSGSIVDIGCGMPPLFLEKTRFARKIGIDLRGGEPAGSVETIAFDVRSGPLPLPDASANAVACLAMIEHVAPADAPFLLREARRILKPGGMLVLTTPTRAAAPLLRILAACHLVSAVEIADHRASYNRASVVSMLSDAGFGSGKIRSGTFEGGMNAWYTAEA